MASPYFFFDLKNHLSAVDAAYVEEVFALPELILIPEAPLGIVGVIELRGDILPVVNLASGTAGQSPRYQTSDHIMVLNQDEFRIGLLINTVHGLREISKPETTADSFISLDWINPDLKQLLSHVEVEEKEVLLLNEPKACFKKGEIQQFLSVTSFLVNEVHNNSVQNTFHLTTTPEEELIFRQRAENLRQSLTEDQSPREVKTFVVVDVQGNLFGIDSEVAREFITVNQATPIPCCPPHIVGNINLRGEILTVVDICELVSLPTKELPRTPKVVILETEAMAVGMIVDEIRDAIFSLSTHEIRTVSDEAVTIRQDYLQGEAPYQDQVMRILDFNKLLLSDALVVNEMI